VARFVIRRLFLAQLLTLLVAALGDPAGAPAAEGWRLVGQLGGPTSAVAVQGNYAYAGIGLRLTVLDISDPANPRELGATAPFPYFVQGIAVSGLAHTWRQAARGCASWTSLTRRGKRARRLGLAGLRRE
jgi:hypothetical protein